MDGNGRSDVLEWMLGNEVYESNTSSGSLNSTNIGSVSDNTDIVSPMSDLNSITGLMLEPSVEFITFIIDAVMSLFTSAMTQTSIEPVMVDNEDIGTLPVYEGYGSETSYTIPNINDYKSATGKLNKVKYPNFEFSIQDIFSGKIELLDVNFIEKSNDNTHWNAIRNMIRDWYKVLRLVAIIGLVSVLIYIGIKILLSATAKDQAKYKEMLLSWLIGVLLAFSMQYIMAFILNVVETIVDKLSGLTGVISVKGSGISLFKTNLMGLARFQLQQHKFTAKVGYLVLYSAFVTYTFKFTFLYLKRMFKMAFLTLISPIVALTYPLDKANDGKAQGFELWLKEFMYNALLQPVHYILYYILVSSSLALASNNMVYAIAAMMFLSQAEKLLKTIFGFNKAKAGTVGGVAGAFATGAVTGQITNLVKDPIHPFGLGKNGESSKGSKNNSSNIDYGDIPDATIDDTNWYDFLGINILGNENTGGNLYSRNDDNRYFNSANYDINNGIYLGESYSGDNSRVSIDNYNRQVLQNWVPDIDDLIYRHQGDNIGLRAELLSGGYGNISEGNINNVMDMIADYRVGRPIDSGATIIGNNSRDNAWTRFKQIPTVKGVANVGRNIIKPVWDTQKDLNYNGPRLVSKALKGAIGVPLGITAAAVQAGISITDGKYNPIEAVATVGAGMVGVSAVGNNLEKKSKEREKYDKKIEHYSSEWYNNDGVIDYYNTQYPGKAKEMRKRASTNYVKRGITDVKEQKQAMKFADHLKEERGMEEEEADKLAIATLQYRQSLKRTKNYKALYDKEHRKTYLDKTAEAYTGAASRNSVIKLHEDFLQNVIEFDNVNS